MARVIGATLAWTRVGSAPSNDVLPAVEGVTLVHAVLSATTGTWTGQPFAFTYQWSADGVDIVGANAPMLTIGADLRTKFIAVTVVAIGIGGQTSATSVPVGPVTSTTGDPGLDFSDPDNSQYLPLL